MLLLMFVILMFVSSLFQAIVGSGSALVAVPVALLFLPQQTVVSSMLVTFVALSAFLSVRIKEPISLRPVLLLFVASVLGMPLGVWMLRALPLPTMQVFVGCLVILFTFLLHWGKLRIPRSTLLTGMAGFFSGLLDTSTTIAGPPVLILLAGQGLAKDQFRRTLACFFLITDVVAALMLFLSGVMTLQTIGYGVAAIPFVFLAGYVGDRVSARLPERPFRLLVLAVLFLAGVYSVFSGLT
jgi:uncharacterized membrane protein YfcA